MAKKVGVIHYDDIVKISKGGQGAEELVRSMEKQGASGLLILLLDADRAHGGYKGCLIE